MSCSNPRKGFDVGEMSVNGKPMYKITGYNVDHLEYTNNTWIPCTSNVKGRYYTKIATRFVEIPCGNCIGCRLQYAREWANRCMLEAKYHEESHFITLTYNDKYLPTNCFVKETGEYIDIPTLVKKDLQDFFKRLRKKLNYDIRYFCCGEYGSQFHRPHFHCIIFGLKLDDLKFNFVKDKYNHYRSQLVEDAWSIYDRKTNSYDPIGFVDVCDVSWDTCCYTARYVMKKQKGKNAREFYEDSGYSPEFVTMSRRPGIARQFYDDNKSYIYEFDEVSVETQDGGLKVKPCKYYDRLFDVDEPEKMARIREIRKFKADNAKTSMLKQSSLGYLELLKVQENVLQNRLKKLSRYIE